MMDAALLERFRQQLELARAYHDGMEVAARRGDVGLLVFQVNEGRRTAMYDIAVLQSGEVRIFVGRNGLLVYSDDPAVKAANPREV